MKLLEIMGNNGHEKILFANDNNTGLKAIIAVHSTALGPALGGARMYDYKSEEDALIDVLRLSQGMTMKNAAAGLPLGGGKAVLMGNPKTLKSEAYWKSFADAVNSLGGRYYTAEDMNTSTHDMDTINKYTEYVVGTSALSSDPSPYTARGVLNAMRAGLVFLELGDFKGKTVAVQGLGNVGYALCRLLHDAGAKLKIFDPNETKLAKAVKEFGAEVCEDIINTECDIFSPCAMGAVITSENAGGLKCKMIAGSANNVLKDGKAGDFLDKEGVLYLPDYIINSGGVINCGVEIRGSYDKDYILEKVEDIYGTTMEILKIAENKKIPTYKAADEYALNIIEKSKK